MAKAGPQLRRRLVITPQQRLQLEQQVVVVQQSPFPAVGRIGLAQPRQGFGMRQKLAGLTLQNNAQLLLLVARLAQKTDYGLCLGKGSIPLGNTEAFPALLDGGRNIRAVHQRKAAPLKPFRPPAAQDAESEGVERPPLHSREALIADLRRALQHFMRSLARKGQQQHGRRRNALFRQPGQTVHDGPGLAAARAGHNQHGAVAAGGGFILGIIQSLSEIYHGIRKRKFNVRKMAGTRRKQMQASVDKISATGNYKHSSKASDTPEKGDPLSRQPQGC